MLRSVQNLGVRNRIKLWRFFQRGKAAVHDGPLGGQFDQPRRPSARSLYVASVIKNALDGRARRAGVKPRDAASAAIP